MHPPTFHIAMQLNFPNIIEHTLSLNVTSNLTMFVFVGSASWKEKENVCEEIVAWPFGDCKKLIVSEPKKKTLRKLKWGINRVSQNRCVARLFGLNLFGGDEVDEVQDLLQDWGRDKLLIPKLVSLIKHLNLLKCNVAKHGMAIGANYVNLNNAHKKNEKLYALQGVTHLLI